MKAWLTRTQFESHIDNVEVSGDKITILMHAHLDGKPIDNVELMNVREMQRRRVLVTLAEYRQVPGLNETKKDIPAEQTGGEKIPK